MIPAGIDTTELSIIDSLKRCRFLPGSFDKKFCRDIDPGNISPLQRWFIYKLGYKYRKQIGNDVYALICKSYIDVNEKPLSRKEAENILKQAIKST